jgi:hypothetical protein
MASILRRTLGAGVALGVVLAVTLNVSGQTQTTPERFTALAVNLERGTSGQVEIVVNRSSTEGERDRLMSTLLERGADKLLDVLQDMPRVGYIRTPESIGYDLHYARRAPLPDGGERVVLVTDRRIGFWEAANRPRSIDYPFTVIELHLNPDGNGEGKISIATKITADKANRIVTLENYSTQPVLLQSVKRERTSHLGIG